ncbi:MAG TPA: ABC transporter permease [Anaerolineae bacterium]
MWRRIWAMTQKEFIELFRTPLLVPALVIGPVLELVLFAAAIHTDVNHIPTVVVDQSRSAASRSYIDAFAASGSFDVVAAGTSQADAIRAIDRGQAGLGIVIPPHFAAQARRGAADALLLVDGSDAIVTQSAAGGAAAISGQYGAGARGGQSSPITAHLQVLYNPDLHDLWFIVPGFGAFLLYGITLKLTAFAIVREREVGTIEALLVTPIRPIEMMLAKTIPNLGLGLLDAAAVLPVGIFLFGVPFRGSVLLFAGLAILFATAGLGLGLAISAISQTQLQANQVSSLLNIGAMFLSGFMFPAYSLPLFLKLIGYALPLTFFMPIIQGVFTKGVGLEALWLPVLALTGLTTAIFIIGARAFRQGLD